MKEEDISEIDAQQAADRLVQQRIAEAEQARRDAEAAQRAAEAQRKGRQ